LVRSHETVGAFEIKYKFGPFSGVCSSSRACRNCIWFGNWCCCKNW